MAADAGSTVRVHMLYLGECTLEGGKVGQDFVLLPDGWEGKKFSKDWGRRCYEKLRVYMPGSVYSVEQREGTTTVLPGTLTWVQVWGDEELVSEWQAAHDASRSRRAVERREKKQTRRRLYLERLEPIRRAAMRMPAPERALLAHRVINAIFSKSPLKSDEVDDEG